LHGDILPVQSAFYIQGILASYTKITVSGRDIANRKRNKFAAGNNYYTWLHMNLYFYSWIFILTDGKEKVFDFWDMFLYPDISCDQVL